MADKKVSELTALTNVSGDDLLLVINDPLGTPASRKITATNLFGNVTPQTTHNGITNFKANTTFTGTKITTSANVIVTAGLSVNSTAILPAIQDRMQVANTTLLVNDRMQVANTTTLVNDRMQVANTTTLVNDRMQVANTVTLVNDRIQVANATLLINDRLQVGNVSQYFVNANLVGDTNAKNIGANTVNIAANTGFVLAGGGITVNVPSTSNTATEGLLAGTIWYSNNHLYIAVDSNTIKRVNLSTF